MKFGKFLESATASSSSPSIPYKRLKKMLKDPQLDPCDFITELEAVCDELELGWRRQALLHAGSQRRGRRWRRLSLRSPTAGECGVDNDNAGMSCAMELGTWAALNALALRKIVKKFDKTMSRRRLTSGSADLITDCASTMVVARETGAQWLQRVAVPRLSFVQSALRLEVLAVATRQLAAERCLITGTAETIVGETAGGEMQQWQEEQAEDEEEEGGGEAQYTNFTMEQQNDVVEPRAAASLPSSTATTTIAPAVTPQQPPRSRPRLPSFDSFEAELNRATDVSAQTECQLCFEVMVRPVAFSNCGHVMCGPCFNSFAEAAVETATARAHGGAAHATPGGGGARCPMCRCESHTVSLVQLTHLAKAMHPDAYASRTAELKAARRSEALRNVLRSAGSRLSLGGVSRAVRALFVAQGDVLRDMAAQDEAPARDMRPRAAPPQHLERLLAPIPASPVMAPAREPDTITAPLAL